MTQFQSTKKLTTLFSNIITSQIIASYKKCCLLNVKNLLFNVANGSKATSAFSMAFKLELLALLSFKSGNSFDAINFMLFFLLSVKHSLLSNIPIIHKNETKENLIIEYNKGAPKWANYKLNHSNNIQTKLKYVTDTRLQVTGRGSMYMKTSNSF